MGDPITLACVLAVCATALAHRALARDERLRLADHTARNAEERRQLDALHATVTEGAAKAALVVGRVDRLEPRMTEAEARIQAQSFARGRG